MQGDEDRIRNVLADFTKAIRNKDAAGAIAPLADDAVTFDLAPPLRLGPAVTHDPGRLELWFASWDSPIVSEPRDLEVEVSGDLAYAYGLQHMTGKKMGGEEVDLWFRATACFRRRRTAGGSRTCTIPCRSRWTAATRPCSSSSPEPGDRAVDRVPSRTSYETGGPTMSKTATRITPCLWFDHEGEEAAKFYTQIFPNSKIGKIARNTEAAPGETGAVLTVQFWLDGEEFLALNGGPEFSFSEAVSFVVHCETQQEVDYYWERLLAGGAPSQCGWLEDRYGLSWQITPNILPELLGDADSAKADRVMAAMMKMVKIDIEGLKKAAEQA